MVIPVPPHALSSTTSWRNALAVFTELIVYDIKTSSSLKHHCIFRITVNTDICVQNESWHICKDSHAMIRF